MKKKIGVLVVFVVLFSLVHLYPAPEQRGTKPLLAPLNPEFVKYQSLVWAGKVQRLSSDGYPLGHVPAPVNLSHVRGVADLSIATSYPTSYDLRSYGKVTDVRNQGGCGACWAFSAMASMESILKPGETWDFSEQHLTSSHGFDYTECAGGHAFMSTAYLTRWAGPLNESDMAYPYAAMPAASTYVPQKHVQQVVFLPERANFLDNDAIKYYLTATGAVDVSFTYLAAYYSNSNHSYYYNVTPDNNHQVAIVGWDDNYAASNFNSAPAGNGAFLAKNSWGSSWGDSGYFYISYYDTSLSDFVSYAGIEANSNYQHIYQYDPLGWVSSVGLDSTTFWGANIFIAQSNLPLRAVGFYTTDVTCHYTIYVYTGVTAGQPRSGTLAATLSGTKSYPGFYTEVLSQAVPLTNGQRFSVVIQFANSSYTYPLAAEIVSDNYSSAAIINSGESYYSENSGGTWDDLGAYGYNACIKAYAASTETIQLTLQASSGGTTNPAPGRYAYLPGSQITIQAIPDDHYIFTSWSGDVSSADNPLTVTMNAAKTINANFRAILAPLAISGNKILNRSLSQAEYINILSWQSNPGNDGLAIATYRIYTQSGSTPTLLAEVPATQTTYTHRLAGRGALTYSVAAITSGGREGFPATITVQ